MLIRIISLNAIRIANELLVELKDKDKQLSKLSSRLEQYESLVSNAAPLHWVANNDIDGAHRWEKLAFDLLNEK